MHILDLKWKYEYLEATKDDSWLVGQSRIAVIMRIRERIL